ncbi:MAG: polysaccharide biosynthesis/export family protein [Muribaculaceae bacterium]|nr:polysaccharide biosynthesis/export family protein [Muribaculaceae bacterium]
MKFRYTVIAATLMLTAASCSTPKNITYFQDLEQGAVVSPAEQLDIRVKPDDKLAILVTTQDPALSSLFNLVQQQQRITGSTTVSVFPGYSYNDGRTSFYTVARDGDINFPVLGKLHIAGMRRDEVARYIEHELESKDLVKDPVVTVEFINTGINIIGEVVRPGRYDFNKDRMTLIDAIAMAGDLLPTGQRNNITVMRQQADGTTKAYRVDLTDMSSLAASPVFYVQQDDVVYVEPNDKKKREATPSGNVTFSPSFWVSIGSLGITIATFIVTTTK